MTYKFTLNGKSYYAGGKNILEAQGTIELAHGIGFSLKGATFEEIWKLKVIRTGIVR